MRRTLSQVLPLERDILRIASELVEQSLGTSRDGAGWFHAYAIAQFLAARHGGSTLRNGTLYRSLHGMAAPERMWLERRLETPEEASSHPGRPRNYYRLTGAGAVALREAEAPIQLNLKNSVAFRFG
ncbi:MAG: PadR family transcriptional regulator [Actinomycetota bacterium]|nr:PadR family transcriptional regulator [Actinomycetota bacterium]